MIRVLLSSGRSQGPLLAAVFQVTTRVPVINPPPLKSFLLDAVCAKLRFSKLGTLNTNGALPVSPGPRSDPETRK
jgi:hypothetical protein